MEDIESAGDHDELWPEALDGGKDQSLESAQVGRLATARQQRDVEVVVQTLVLAALGEGARALRVAVFLVRRDGKRVVAGVAARLLQQHARLLWA